MIYTLSRNLLLALLLSCTLNAQSTEANYHFLNTQASGTLEKELNQQAAAGWRLLLLPRAYNSDDMGALLGRAEAEKRYEYKVLAAARIGTLEKEFLAATQQGFDFRGIITKDNTVGRALIGNFFNETLLVLERVQGQTTGQNEYIFLNTKKESTLEKEMDANVSQGYLPLGFARTEDNSVKQKMFGVMAGSPYELTLILARNREKPASAMGAREYKVLTTMRRGTMEKEMNQMAKEGYRFHYSSVGSITIMARDPKEKTAQYEYKILGTNRVETMEKEMNELSAAGYAYRATSTGGGGLATIFEKKLAGAAAPKYETKLLTKLTDSGINKSIQDLKKSGFELVDVTNLGTFLLVLQKDPEK
jgi:hypothetical protein